MSEIVPQVVGCQIVLPLMLDSNGPPRDAFHIGLRRITPESSAEAPARGAG